MSRTSRRGGGRGALTVLLMALLSAILLAGPGCEREERRMARNGEENARQPVIGVSIPAATHGWPAGIGWWAERMMAENPDVQWRYQRASTADEQVSQLETMLERGLDVLVVLPFDSGTPMTVIRRAKERGVYVVSVDRGLREPIADVYVAGDNRAFGRVAGEYMAEQLDPGSRIVVLRGNPQTEIDGERFNAGMEVFNREGIEVLASQPGNWSREQAHEVMQGWLTRFDQIDAVWAADDDMALGVEQALREAGRTDEMWVVGGGGMKQVVERIKGGDRLFPATVSYPPSMIAAGIGIGIAAARGDELPDAAELIPDHLGITREKLDEAAGQEGQKTVVIEIFLITPENAERFHFPESVY